MKNSMRTICPIFNSNRMLEEYLQEFYVNAAEVWGKITKDKYKKAIDLVKWKKQVLRSWDKIKVNLIEFENHAQSFHNTKRQLIKLLHVREFSSAERRQLRHLIHSINTSQFDDTPPDAKFKNTMARRYESDISTTFLLNPTTNMLAAVKAMSDRDRKSVV